MAMMTKYFFYLILFAVTVMAIWFTMDYEGVTRSAATSKVSNIKYILRWTKPKTDIWWRWDGMETFVRSNCSYSNCYVTRNVTFFHDIRLFNVILFTAAEFSNIWKIQDIPRVRAPGQKYIFSSEESSDNHPMCVKGVEGFFNWTWTYKLDSDLFDVYIAIKNKRGEIVGPKSVMHWEKVDAMEPVDDKLKEKLSTKSIAAAWFVSNCNARNGRLTTAKQLQSELATYNLTLDIYGRCGTKICPQKHMNDCLQMVERNYYFYLSFENSFSEDYVTEKLLHALQNYAVPVVYGGANYSRFMPDGIYLDARRLGVNKLALRMAEIIKDKEKYYELFKWRNHYSYHHSMSSPDTDCYCKLCALINNEKLFNTPSVYENLASWWNPPGRCKNV